MNCDHYIGSGVRSLYSNYYDEIATASCTAIASSKGIIGHLAAVRRKCSGKSTCDDVCNNAPQTPYYRGNSFHHILISVYNFILSFSLSVGWEKSVLALDDRFS